MELFLWQVSQSMIDPRGVQYPQWMATFYEKHDRIVHVSNLLAYLRYCGQNLQLDKETIGLCLLLWQRVTNETHNQQLHPVYVRRLALAVMWLAITLSLDNAPRTCWAERATSVTSPLLAKLRDTLCKGLNFAVFFDDRTILQALANTEVLYRHFVQRVQK